MQKPDLEEIQTRLEENQPLPSNPEPLPSQPLENQALWELWVRMNEIYGHQWASQHGVEPSQTWVAGLSDISTADIGVGVRACLNRDKDWPPNLNEFRKLCGAGFTAQERASHRPFQPERTLPDTGRKERTSAAHQQAMAKMRQELGI